MYADTFPQNNPRAQETDAGNNLRGHPRRVALPNQRRKDDKSARTEGN